jgi:hypothetical protein
MGNRFIEILQETFPFSFDKDECIEEFSLLHIGEKHVQEIILTDAELKLFKEGFEDGKIILQDTLIGIDSGNIIRSEILEWLLTLPEKYNYLFRKNCLEIQNGCIIRMQQYIDYKENKFKDLKDDDIYVFEIPNKNVSIDICFNKCVFFGGINFSKATLKNTRFSLCKFGIGDNTTKDFFTKGSLPSSIYADQAIFKGNLVIEGKDDTGVFKSFSSDCKGPLIFTNSIVENSLDIWHVITNQSIDLSFATIENINIFQLYVFYSDFKLLYGNIKNIYIQSSLFVAKESNNSNEESIAIDCSGTIADYLFIRNQCRVIGSVLLKNLNIKFSIDLTKSIFISPQKANLDASNDISMELKGSSASELMLCDETISIGTLNAQNTKIQSVLLDHSKFINYSKGTFRKAIVMSGSHIENFVRFNNKAPKIVETMQESDEKYVSYFEKNYNALRSILPKVEDQSAEINKYHEILDNVFIHSEIISKVLEIENSLYKEIAKSTLKQIKPEDIHSNGKQSIINWGRGKEKNEKPDEIRLENIYSGFVNNYTLIVGEADFSSVYINRQLDCAGGFFYGKEHDNNKENFSDWSNNALNLKYLRLDGDLFLNDCENNKMVPHFKAYGEVDLHSAKVHQFFISPRLGIDPDTKWRATGLKYEYIYSGGDKNKRLLEKCDWFEDYIKEDNFRQPYEQLAAAFDKAGDDASAKKVLIRGRLKTSKNPIELILFGLFALFSFLGIPAWRSFLALFFIFTIGGGFFYNAYENKGFTIDDRYKTEEFRPFWYSMENMLPFSFQQKEIFMPNSTEIPVPLLKGARINNSLFVSFHKVFSTLFLAIFIIGITKITKRDN